ncbi:hypothetical protein BH160DRAFT_3573 [Burkholderia sp. H160]|nr:hypothetical protein BH160DRAFT_3573 [Burkholderia sp. H160]
MRETQEKRTFFRTITNISFPVEFIVFETFFANLINLTNPFDVLPESGKGPEPDGANLAQQGRAGDRLTVENV